MFNVNLMQERLKRPMTIEMIPNYHHYNFDEKQFIDFMMWVSHVFDGRPITRITELKHERRPGVNVYRAKIEEPSEDPVGPRLVRVRDERHLERPDVVRLADGESGRLLRGKGSRRHARRVYDRGGRHGARHPGLRDEPAAEADGRPGGRTRSEQSRLDGPAGKTKRDREIILRVRSAISLIAPWRCWERSDVVVSYAIKRKMKPLKSVLQKQPLIVVILSHAILIALFLVAANGLYSTVKYGVYGHKGAKVYYDAVHGARHLWNRDNRRYRSDYHSISGFFRFFRSMEQEGFKPHAETYDCFNRSILNKYDVFFVGEQTYQGRFMTEAEQETLIDWVADGGGLFVLAEHTDAHYMDEIVNELFKNLPIKARFDAINEVSPTDPSWLALADVKRHPITEGVREYHFYNGCSLDTPYGVLFSSSASWSDKYNPKDAPVNNGNKKKDPDEMSGPLAGAAAFAHGKGRVVVVGDHNAFSNLELYFADHHRFIFNSLKWLAGDRVNMDFLFGIAAVLLIVLGFLVAAKTAFRNNGIANQSPQLGRGCRSRDCLRALEPAGPLPILDA